MFSYLTQKIIYINTTTDAVIIEYGFWRYIRKREKTIENCPDLKLLVSTSVPSTLSNIIKCLFREQTSMTREYFNTKYKAR